MRLSKSKRMPSRARTYVRQIAYFFDVAAPDSTRATTRGLVHEAVKFRIEKRAVLLDTSSRCSKSSGLLAGRGPRLAPRVAGVEAT